MEARSAVREFLARLKRAREKKHMLGSEGGGGEQKEEESARKASDVIIISSFAFEFPFFSE